MWRKKRPCALLVGMEIGAATLENIVEIHQQIKNRITTRYHNSTVGYLLPSNENTNLICTPMYIVAL